MLGGKINIYNGTFKLSEGMTGATIINTNGTIIAQGGIYQDNSVEPYIDSVNYTLEQESDGTYKIVLKSESISGEEILPTSLEDEEQSQVQIQDQSQDESDSQILEDGNNVENNNISENVVIDEQVETINSELDQESNMSDEVSDVQDLNLETIEETNVEEQEVESTNS